MKHSFWLGKRVLLTGHTGFKGSWMALWLHTLGAQVCGYALAPNTESNLYTILGLEKQIESHIGNIVDYEHLNKTVLDFKPDIIIHMAAQPLVRYSYEHPVETYATNVMGTVNILEIFRHSDAKILLNITTDKCYENKERSLGYSENEPLGGYDPYSNSKACSELVTSAYRNSFFNPKDYANHGKGIASARAGNVIGGGDWSQDRLVPDLVNSLIQGKPITLRYPHSIRPWQHVFEPLSGYMQLVEQLWQQPENLSEAFNFGPLEADCISVGDLAKAFAREWGQSEAILAQQTSVLHEAGFLKLDISKAKSRLNWQPRSTIRQAIQYTADWYKNWQTGADMKAFSLQQLNEFELMENSNE
ncbi:MAG: CDP-glucose 4,6-dehydratase [Gammaproteobacteria bacterium]|nr:CDP-glucose 4,6-dehydratase [Gammaproteobacteria bacterium]